MVLFYVGIVLVLVAVVLYFFRSSQIKKVRDVKSAETVTVADLTKLAEGVKSELSDGSQFRQIVEVKGVVRCDSPLSAEISGQPCVHYETSISREYEETYWETDSQTQRQEQKTRRTTQHVAGNKRSVDFWVEDATGRVRVNPSGAQIEATKVVDRFESGEAQMSGAAMLVGGMSLNVGGVSIGMGPGNRTIGYHIRESIVPPDNRVYVLGEASTSSGDLTIQMPSQKGRFLISVRSEEEIIRSAESKAVWLLVAMVGSGALGVVLAVLGLVRR